jgi:hypothetical protein
MEGVQMSQINDTGMLEMMRGTPPPTWEQTCLKLSEEKRELQSDVNELKELVEHLQDRIKKLKIAGNAMYEFINPPSPCMRTIRMDNLLQGWDDAKIGKEVRP